MDQSAAELLAIAGKSLATWSGEQNQLAEWGSIGDELAAMLRVKNGFYAYSSALLVRPLSSPAAPLGLREWNSPALWKRDYDVGLGDVLFFAEDVFGEQYGIRQNQVCRFDPETAEFEACNSSLAAWVTSVMSDPNERTGYCLATEWQRRNEPLAPGSRLLAKVPFVCGGQYDIANLYALNDVQGMRFRAALANQIRELPDGAQVVFKPLVDRLPDG